MKGKEHMIVGTTATATMGIGFLITKTFDSAVYLAPLIIGGFIGSYMPDIDSHNSKARQVFNKVLTFSIIAIVLGYMLGIALSVSDVLNFLENNIHNCFATVMFCITTVLGKLSPHIVCDRFSPRGKNLKFFEFKLPCKNSKNKTTITW